MAERARPNRSNLDAPGDPSAVLTLLGTGTSAGVPLIGCDCATCTSDDPRDRRLRTAAMLRFNDARGTRRTVLLDVGPDHRQQALTHRIDRADHILLTHSHVDHVWGLDEVRRYNALMGTSIPVIGDGRTIDEVRRIYAHVFDRARNANDSWVADLTAMRVEPGETLDCHGIGATAVPMLHGRLPILAWRFDGPGPLFPLVYATDVNGIPPESWRHLVGTRTLVLDGLRFRSHPTHFTIDQAIDAAARIGAARTVLVHMTHDVLHDRDARNLPEGVEFGFDGLELR
jgi:phosphoribosyl 1,2-cyclic phosphate phosphodiesterase